MSLIVMRFVLLFIGYFYIGGLRIVIFNYFFV